MRVRNIAGVRGLEVFSWALCASCNASLSAYPASMEADLEPAGDGQPRRGARFWPPAWSFADCDVFTVAVTGKGCHDLSKDIQLANRMIRGERSQVLSAGVVVALEQPVLLVFLNTIQVTRTPHVFFAPPCIPDDRTAMALFSAARSTSPPPIPEVDRRAGRKGVAQLGVSRHGRPFVVCASVAGRLQLPASASPSAPVSAARRSVGGLARVCGARHARARLRGSGGGGDGARRGGRLFVFLARLGLAAGGAGSVWVLPRFFSRSVRIPDARGPGSVRSVFEWVGGGCAAKWRFKNTRGVLFLLTEGR